MFLIVFSLLLSGSIIPQVRSELLPGNSSTTEQSQTECPSCDALQTASPSVQPLASLTSATIDASGAEAAVQELVAAQNEMHAEPASLAHVHMVQFRDHLHQRTQLIVVGCTCVVFLVGLGFVLSVRVCAKRNSHRAQVRSLMRSEHDAKTLGNISLNDPTGLTPMVTPQSSSKADNEICDGLQSGNGASESSHTGEIASMMGGGETDPELDRNPTITKIVINSGPYNDLDETGP